MNKNFSFYKKPDNFFLVAVLVVVIVFIAISQNHINPTWVISGSFVFLVCYYLGAYSGWKLKIENDQTLICVTGLFTKKKINISNIIRIQNVSRIGANGGAYPALCIFYKNNRSIETIFEIPETDYDKNVLGRFVKKLITINKTIEVDDTYLDEIHLGSLYEIISETLSAYAPKEGDYMQTLNNYYTISEDLIQHPQEIKKILQFCIDKEIPQEDMERMQKEILEKAGKISDEISNVKFYQNPNKSTQVSLILLSLLGAGIYLVTYIILSELFSK